MKAAFGAGCFWHVQEEFDKLKDVIKTEVGYMGGSFKNPTYENVCSDKTGHAEIVLIEYNEKKISFKELLNVFWKMHNPTTKDRQGLDIGSQYRSIILYFTEKQKKEAIESRKDEQKKYKNKIVTEIKKAGNFYKAEKYHQHYLMKKWFRL